MPLIEYNSTEVFANQIPPLVAKTTNFIAQNGGRVASEDRITLRGELTGCGLADLVAARNSAAGVFATNFKDLVVDGTTFEKVKIQSFNFDQSDYLHSVPYSIDVLYYTGFQIADGVINASNQYTYTENADQTITMRQSISAKGVNTPSSSALDNATAFVSAQATEFPRPALIDTKGTDFEGCLTDVSTTTDKINNTVSVDRSFKTDPTAIEGGTILRYTKEISEQEGQPIKVTYAGTVDGCRNGAMPDEAYKQFMGGIEATILDENVTEDPGINRVTFSFSYEDKGDEDPDTSPDVMDDFTITINEGASSSLVNMCINGTLSTKEGCMGKRLAKVKGAYQGDSHGFDMCQDIYDTFYDQGPIPNPGVSLNTEATSSNTSDNETAETMSYSACFNDRDNLDTDACSIDYTLQCQPSLRAIHAVPSAVSDNWVILDLGYNKRAKLSVSVVAKGGNVDAHDFAWAKINKVLGPGAVKGGRNLVVDTESSSITMEGAYSFSLGVSFNSASAATDPESSYKTITSFIL